MTIAKSLTKTTVTGGEGMGIEEIFRNTSSRGPGVSFARNVPAKTRDEISSNMRKVVIAIDEGQHVSLPDIVKWVNSKYDVPIDRSTIVLWLVFAREELNVENK